MKLPVAIVGAAGIAGQQVPAGLAGDLLFKVAALASTGMIPGTWWR
jgi:hypothetical protein